MKRIVMALAFITILSASQICNAVYTCAFVRLGKGLPEKNVRVKPNIMEKLFQNELQQDKYGGLVVTSKKADKNSCVEALHKSTPKSSPVSRSAHNGTLYIYDSKGTLVHKFSLHSYASN